jgi:4-hydroxybenzoate polyprenyltransferase
MVSKLLFLIQVSRPIIWPVMPLFYCLGLNSSHAPVSVPTIVQMLLLTFPMNLIGCGLNDIYDYESDHRSTRRRVGWGTVVRKEDQALVFRASLTMVPLMLLGALLTRNWDNIVATVSLVLVAWLYSVPPIRLRERPPLDSLANGVGYFLPFVMAFSLNADPRTMPFRYYLLALCICGVHSLAAAADYPADRAAGHRTVAVVFGQRTAAAIGFAAFLLAALAGDFHGTAIRIYIVVSALMSLAATLFPRDYVIFTTCGVVFAGFLITAAFHLNGW